MRSTGPQPQVLKFGKALHSIDFVAVAIAWSCGTPVEVVPELTLEFGRRTAGKENDHARFVRHDVVGEDLGFLQ